MVGRGIEISEGAGGGEETEGRVTVPKEKKSRFDLSGFPEEDDKVDGMGHERVKVGAHPRVLVRIEADIGVTKDENTIISFHYSGQGRVGIETDNAIKDPRLFRNIVGNGFGSIRAEERV